MYGSRQYCENLGRLQLSEDGELLAINQFFLLDKCAVGCCLGGAVFSFIYHSKLGGRQVVERAGK